MLSTGSTSSSPSQLNFAFMGTFTAGSDQYVITLGQGSDGAGVNNWWLGVPQGWTWASSGMLQSPDGNWQIKVDPHSHYTYWIAATGTWGPPDPWPSTAR